jgi:sulfoxide reductase heme-binding subunit YedZ
MEIVRAHIRAPVYTVSIILAVFIYALVVTTYQGSLEIIRLEEWYGFTAFVFIYLALLPTPLYAVFPALPGKAVVTRARRAIGISGFLYAVLHSAISFWGLLDGFAGLPFLPESYTINLSATAIALIILFLLAVTSFDVTVLFMGSWWKRLHRFLYGAGVLILFHVVTLGANFTDLGDMLPSIALLFVFLLLLLEVARIDKKYFIGMLGFAPRVSVPFIISSMLLAAAISL